MKIQKIVLKARGPVAYISYIYIYINIMTIHMHAPDNAEQKKKILQPEHALYHGV